MSNKIELGYWKYRGLGHPIRFLLQYLGVPYEEKNYFLPEGKTVTENNWLEVRSEIRKQYPPQLYFPNVPYLIDGKTYVSESRAIMRYIARTYGPELLGKTPEIQVKIDMLENYLYDFWYMVFAARIYQDSPTSIANFNSQHPERLGRISQFVGQNNWSTGNDLTYMDFLLCEFLFHLIAYDKEILEPYPNLKRLMENFKKLPAITNYMNSSDFFEAPYYSTRANYKM